MATELRVECGHTCARHNVHGTYVQANLYQQFREGTFCDVTLRVGQKELKVHQFVMAAACERLSQVGRGAVVQLGAGFSMNALRAVIDYVYKGEIVLNGDDVGDVLSLASYLKIKPLKLHCAQYLLRQLAPANCVRVWSLASKFCIPELLLLTEALIYAIFCGAFVGGEAGSVGAPMLADPAETKVARLVVGWLAAAMETKRKKALMEDKQSSNAKQSVSSLQFPGVFRLENHRWVIMMTEDNCRDVAFYSRLENTWFTLKLLETMGDPIGLLDDGSLVCIKDNGLSVVLLNLQTRLSLSVASIMIWAQKILGNSFKQPCAFSFYCACGHLYAIVTVSIKCRPPLLKIFQYKRKDDKWWLYMTVNINIPGPEVSLTLGTYPTPRGRVFIVTRITVRLSEAWEREISGTSHVDVYVVDLKKKTVRHLVRRCNERRPLHSSGAFVSDVKLSLAVSGFPDVLRADAADNELALETVTFAENCVESISSKERLEWPYSDQMVGYGLAGCCERWSSTLIWNCLCYAVHRAPYVYKMFLFDRDCNQWSVLPPTPLPALNTMRIVALPSFCLLGEFLEPSTAKIMGPMRLHFKEWYFKNWTGVQTPCETNS